MNTDFDTQTHAHQTQELPAIEVAGPTVAIDPARRFDRTLLTVVAVAVVTLIVGSIVMFGPNRTTDAEAPVQPAAPTPVAPEAAVPTPDQVPAADGTPAVIDMSVDEPAGDVEDVEDPEVLADPEPPAEPVAEEPADQPDPGDPDPAEPEVNPCMTAADLGEQFFAPTEVMLEAGELGGSFRIGSCTAAPLAIELITVPGVLLSHSEFDLEPGGNDIYFMIVPEFFDDADIEFKIKVYEVDCCASYVTVTAEKAWGLGELMPFDPGIYSMLTDTNGIDPDDADAVTEQFIVEYGWHPGFLDAPEAYEYDEDLASFIEQYDLASPWATPDE